MKYWLVHAKSCPSDVEQDAQRGTTRSGQCTGAYTMLNKISYKVTVVRYPNGAHLRTLDVAQTVKRHDASSRRAAFPSNHKTIVELHISLSYHHSQQQQYQH